MDYKWDLIDEEGREEIFKWSVKRREKYKGYGKSRYDFMVYTFNLRTLKSFLQNFNFMVLMQMLFAGIAVYICSKYDIYFDVHIALFVSPIVFPLAFSINTDFQRREKVLEDLATFKSHSMICFFCMRDWQTPSGLDEIWMTAAHQKLTSMLFHLREYLLTSRVDRRSIILTAMYEDFSDTNQLIEKIRESKLPSNSAIVCKAIHFLNMMILSFERLRVIREYRSPRSIRSFNKILIFILPFVLAPHFVHLARNSKSTWSPYFISVLVAFVFAALQGVQDKLDDPFDGFSEDDIDIETLDEWTFQSLLVTANRHMPANRFKIVATAETFIETIKPNNPSSDLDELSEKQDVPLASPLLKPKEHRTNKGGKMDVFSLARAKGRFKRKPRKRSLPSSVTSGINRRGSRITSDSSSVFSREFIPEQLNHRGSSIRVSKKEGLPCTLELQLYPAKLEKSEVSVTEVDKETDIQIDIKD